MEILRTASLESNFTGTYRVYFNLHYCKGILAYNNNDVSLYQLQI